MPDNRPRSPCTLDNCGHMQQLDKIVDLLKMSRGTRLVLDELRLRLTCEHEGLTATFSGGDPQRAGRVQWCTGCGSIRYERHVGGEWSWSEWMPPCVPMPKRPTPPTVPWSP